MSVVIWDEVKKYFNRPPIVTKKSRDFSAKAKRRRASKVFRFKIVGKAFHRGAGRRGGQRGLPSRKYRIGA